MVSTRTKKTEPLLEPFSRPYGVSARRWMGVTGWGTMGPDHLGLQGHLREIGKFNPTYVDPWLQRLMRVSAMPRFAMILMGSAMAERQYVVEGATPELEDWYQGWLDAFLPQLVKTAPNATWYGWQPLILDWGFIPGPGGQGFELAPREVHDVDPYDAEALEDELGGFAGLRVGGHDFGPERGIALTWEGFGGNVYGTPQAITVYPWWWAHSVIMVWMMRYYERSVDPLRIGFARNESIPTGRTRADGEPEEIDLSRMVAAALDALSGGDAGVLPLPDSPDDAPLADVRLLEMADRSDTWLKVLGFLQQMMLLASLANPSVGVSGAYGEVSAGDAKSAERMHLRILEHITEMIVDALQGLVGWMHSLAGFPGLPPRVRGASFKRDQQEKMTQLFRDALMAPVAGPEGQSYRPVDIVKWPRLARALNLPTHELADIVDAWQGLTPAAPADVGGRPREHAINPDIPSGDDHGHESRPEERLDEQARSV